MANQWQWIGLASGPIESKKKKRKSGKTNFDWFDQFVDSNRHFCATSPKYKKKSLMSIPFAIDVNGVCVCGGGQSQ